jgi:hypothetical protein
MIKKKSNNEPLFPMPPPKVEKTLPIDLESSRDKHPKNEILDETAHKKNITISTQSINDEELETFTPEVNLVEDIETEEIVYNIANILKSNLDFMIALSEAVSEKLLQQITTAQAINFINKGSSNQINTEIIDFKRSLLSLSNILQDLFVQNIGQTISKIVEEKTLRSGIND